MHSVINLVFQYSICILLLWYNKETSIDKSTISVYLIHHLHLSRRVFHADISVQQCTVFLKFQTFFHAYIPFVAFTLLLIFPFFLSMYTFLVIFPTFIHCICQYNFCTLLFIITTSLCPVSHCDILFYFIRAFDPLPGNFSPQHAPCLSFSL